MSRLTSAFAARAGATGLIPFVTVGYPSVEATLEILRGLDRAGAMAVELGVPFSDPIADGPDIQRASEWAVREGVGLADVLDVVERFRRESQLPIVIMTYANPVVCMGAESFAQRARQAGVDAVLLSDVPPGELPALWAALDAEALDTILLVAPTTDPARMPALLARCRGFVYCLTRTGVTGQAGGYAGALDERIAQVRVHTKLPIALGFGISTPADATALKGRAEALVVGAAFMRRVTEDPRQGAPARVVKLAEELVLALR